MVRFAAYHLLPVQLLAHSADEASAFVRQFHRRSGSTFHCYLIGDQLVAPAAITFPMERTEGTAGFPFRLTICWRATIICAAINTGSVSL